MLSGGLVNSLISRLVDKSNGRLVKKSNRGIVDQSGLENFWSAEDGL